MVSCTGNISGDSVTITGLNQGLSHTVTVWATCEGPPSARLINDTILEANFTTLSGPTLSVDESSNSIHHTYNTKTSTSLTLEMTNHSDAWWYKYTTPSEGNCSSEIPAGTTMAKVTGLTPKTSYTFKAYSDACITPIATAAEASTLRPKVTGLTVSPLNADKLWLGLFVEWTGQNDAEGYEVQWKSDGNGGYNSASRQVRTINTNTYLTIPGAVNDDMVNGTPYTVRVRSTKANVSAGQGEWSDTKSGTPAEETLTASRVSSNGATLTLGNYKGQGNWYYMHTTPPNGSCAHAADGGTSAVVPLTTRVTGLKANTRYVFKAYSNDDCLTLLATAAEFLTPRPATKPNAPFKPEVSAGDRSVTLTWAAGGNGGSAITGWEYIKKVGNDWDSDWTAVPNSGADTTSYTVENLTNGTMYRFRVRAVNAVGIGTESAESDEVTPSTTPAAPSKPAVSAGDRSVTLTWAAGGNGGSAVTGWEYTRHANGSWDSDWTTIQNSNAATTSYTVQNLVNGTTYRFRVRAVNAVGAGAASAASDAVTPLVAAGPAAQRLSALNEALLPEAARAWASGTAAAVSARLGRLSTGSAPSPAAPLASLLARYGQDAEAGEISLREVLGGAEMAGALAQGPAGEGFASAAGTWLSGDHRDLSGGGHALDWDGSASALHLGADAPFGAHRRAGLALSFSEAEFDYTDAGADEAVEGEFKARMTSVHPYVAQSRPDGSGLWALLGYGEGRVEIDDEAAGRQKADSRMKTAAAGVRLRVSPQSAGAPALDLKGEAFSTRLSVDSNDAALQAADADAHRLALALEGSAVLDAGSGSVLAPSAQAGLRWDGGDGETGWGVELGAGVSWTDPVRRLTVAANARTLLAHESELDEWGISGVVQLDPDARGRGLSFSLRPALGAVESGAVRLWQEGVAMREAGDARPARPAARLDAESGYGMAGPGGGLLVPFAGLGLDDAGMRRYRLGLRLRHRTASALDLEGSYRDTGAGHPEHALSLQWQVYW